MSPPSRPRSTIDSDVAFMSEASDPPHIHRFDRPEAEVCEYVGPEGVFWSRGATIYRSDDLNGPLYKIARVPLRGANRLLVVHRLGRRMGRLSFYNVLPVTGRRLFFSFAREIGMIGPAGVTPIGGRERRSRILRNAVCRCPDGSLLFGDYFDNARREPVAIYRWAPGAGEVTLVHHFGPGEIRHVHSVSWDPIAARAVVATGDIGDECRLLGFDPTTGAWDEIGRGDETWRTISPQFGTDAIYYGTDAQFEQNRLYRLDRKTGERRMLAELNGPLFYSAPVVGGWVFGTTAELCPSQTSSEAVLHHLDAATEAVRVLGRFCKDALSTRWFQFGILNLPSVAMSVPVLPFSGTALRGLDGTFAAVRA